MEETPEETGSESQGRFEHKDEGYPLVVADMLSLVLYCRHVLLYCVVRRQVKRVAHLCVIRTCTYRCEQVTNTGLHYTVYTVFLFKLDRLPLFEKNVFSVMRFDI